MTSYHASNYRKLLPVVICVSLACGLGIWLHVRDSALRPMHSYHLTTRRLNHWKAFGGNWEIVDGSIYNNSDERGAKLITGSRRWSDYTLRADLHFDGDHGDMGVIVRSNDPEEGVDSYRGYYAGLRTTDGTLVIGRADYGWMEARPVPMPGGVSDKAWYRLTVTSYQCDIAAEAQNLSTQQRAWIVLDEHPCVESGAIGLRSLATGGQWRNISVTPAGLDDYLRIRQHVGNVSHPEFPKRESDYNRLLPIESMVTSYTQQPTTTPSPAPEATHIGDLLNLLPTAEKEVVLRGVVTLTKPDLYIQDSTGGILVKYKSAPTLNVGDVVEIHGRVQPGLYSAVIKSDSIRLLWIGTPVPPISITPSQAASGAYDARFVEIEGRLTQSEASRKGVRTLYLTDGIQSFRTVDVSDDNDVLSRIKIGSYLRLHGICALNQSYTDGLTPFVILLRSNEDIQVLADPPWWNPWHESLLFAGILFSALLVQVLYFRIQRWKSDTITRERERLAHEIHDTMAQGFAGIGYQIQGIRKTVAHSDQVDTGHVSDQLTMAYQLVRRCHEEASRTIVMLSSASPTIQEDLLGTLAEAAQRIASDQIRIITTVEGNPVPLRLRIANALLHIGREAIANAAGHSVPTELVLTLIYDENCVELIIKDNGHGFEFSQEKAGFGILGMQKRARDVGGVLRISSLPGIGTEVHATVGFHNDTVTRRIINLLKDSVQLRTEQRRT